MTDIAIWRYFNLMSGEDGMVFGLQPKVRLNSGWEPRNGRISTAFASAIAAAAEFAGATSPNPPVGCVVLDAQGNILASETHQRAGTSHAEAAAIAACHRARVSDRIDTIVVTLEPCNHFGRTPPCTQAIMATPAKTVWIGVADPNPRVRGAGATELEGRGFTVKFLETLDHPETANLLRAAKRLIGPFAKWSATARPWITVKQALTADGGMVPPRGQKTFTSNESLVVAHRLRRRSDAIITGSGTVLADKPLFTVRHVKDHLQKRRHLAILDRRRRTPRHYLDAANDRGFEVRLESDINETLIRLGDAGVLEVLVEAGPSVLAAFQNQDLWDEIVTIQVGAVDKISVKTQQGLAFQRYSGNGSR